MSHFAKESIASSNSSSTDGSSFSFLHPVKNRVSNRLNSVKNRVSNGVHQLPGGLSFYLLLSALDLRALYFGSLSFQIARMGLAVKIEE